MNFLYQRFCPELSEKKAKKVLLCSIYEVDDVDVTLMDSPVAFHITVATPKNKVLKYMINGTTTADRKTVISGISI